jgi:DNA-directed RNA polymerase specialized sigma24 family protein
VSVDRGARPDSLLDELRNGERAAFVRFYELHRLPVYNLVLRLVRGDTDATALTQEVFIRAYRQLLLHGGAIDAGPLVYKVAIETCSEHGGPSRDDRPQEPDDGRAAQSGGWEGSPLARRFEQTLQTLDDRQRAALLLNDVLGLSRDETSAVLGLSVEATAALLFRASERFRYVFEELLAGRADGTCRLAETAAASAVGRHSLPADETRKLREHAEYCRQCSTTMATWAAPTIGLSLFAKDAPLPRSLQVVPVFGTTSPTVDGTSAGEARAGLAGAGGSATVIAMLASVGRALTSKAAAYAVAATCSAAFLGLAVYVSQHEWPTQRPPVASPGHSVTAASRPAGKTSVAQTSRRSVASTPSGPASGPSGKARILVRSTVAETLNEQDLVTPALAEFLPHASSLNQIRPLPAPSGGALPGGRAAADNGIAAVHRKANKDHDERAGGGRASRRAGSAGDTRLGIGSVRLSEANRPAHGARQRLNLHRKKIRHTQKA